MRRAYLRLAAASLVIVLVAGLGLEAYSRRADRFDVAPLALPADSRSVVLIFHGSGDGKDPVLEEIAERFRALAGAGTVVINYRWSSAADHRLRAAANAVRLGHALGAELARLPELSALHLIAHSAGAYVPDALCEAYRAAGGAPARIEMTFLDPFGIRGFFDWTHGARTHGRCADFAESIISTDDNAPATNTPLRQAFNLDVTRDPGRAGFALSGHYWPLAYYLEHLDAADATAGSRTHAQLPRGALQRVGR